MTQIFRVLWEAMKDFWEELLLLALMNVVTMLLAIPVVTFPPALAGLWSTANLVAKGKGIHWSDYFGGFRRYFWKAWGLALLNILVAIIVLTNLRFYAQDVVPLDISPTVSLWIRSFFVATAALWLITQIYTMALLLEQEDQRLRLALRNAVVLFIANPGFTIVLALLLLILTAISTLIPVLWAMVTWGFFAVLCNKAVLHLLQPFRERMLAEAEDEAGEEEKREKEGATQADGPK
jgi:uncharacterized membrane protein YesL